MFPKTIASILDNDLYKFTMQKAVLDYDPELTIVARHKFNNRRKEGKFNQRFASMFKYELEAMSNLSLSETEFKWFESTCSWMGKSYFHFLKDYRFDPSEVKFEIHDGELELEINGFWGRTILWEVPLMAMISQCFFETCDTDWSSNFNIGEYAANAHWKGKELRPYLFADFGTRRRRNLETQEAVVKCFSNLEVFPNFVGTSNVHLAMKYGVKPLGTLAHEWIMGISALEGLTKANRNSMELWNKSYKGNLGTALPDTFGTNAFFEDFCLMLAKQFDGVRHDSGDPIEFAEKTIKHYEKMGIDPTTKTIIFSDGLNVEKALEIARTLTGRIRFSFGIGTFFTNDVPLSKALNMVIKLDTCNGVPVVKLSDDLGKAIGDKDALRVAKWTFNRIPLDA